MRQLRILLLLCALPAVALETPVADPVRSGMRGNEYAEAAASDGTDYLFIWRSEWGSTDRYAARVTRDGAVLDRVALPIRQRVEHLVWTGSAYLAVWTSQDVGGRVSIESMRLDRNGNVVASRTLKQGAFVMACIANGNGAAIAYTDYSYTSPLRRPQALILNADGDPLADLVLAEEDWRLTYEIAWNGTHFAAVWIAASEPYDDRRYAVHGIRFDRDGRIDPTPRVLLESMAGPTQLPRLSLQSDGRDFLLIHPSGGQNLARRVSADLGTSSAAQLLPGWIEYSWNAKTHRIGSDYVLFARVPGSNVALRLDRDGAPLGTEVIENTPGSSSIDLLVAATNGDDVAFAWTGFSPGSGCADADLFATVVSASTFDRKFQQLVSIAPREQQSPLVAAGGTNVLTAWVSGSAVYTRRFSTTGAPIDAAPLLLDECATATSIAFNGRDYFVFLSRVGGFDIKRLPRDGVLRAETGASVNGTLIAVAGTAILWSANDGIHLSRLNADGSLQQTASLGAMPQARRMTMAASDNEFLIAWDEQGEELYCTPPQFGSPPIPRTCYPRNLIRGARISSDLVNRDPIGFDIATVSPFAFDPAVTWNGRQWLVAWHAAGTPRSANGPRVAEEIRGRFVSRDGTLDENLAGLLIATDATSPSLAWDGMRYVVGYTAPSRATRIGWLSELGAPLMAERELVSDAFVAVTGVNTVVATYTRGARAFVSAIESGSGTKRRTTRP